MKKIIMILSLVAIGLTACKKEDIKPNGQVDCNCGIVMYDNFAEARFDPYTTRKIVVRNDCSNKTITVYSNQYGHNPLPTPEMQNAYDVGALGEVYCDLQSW